MDQLYFVTRDQHSFRVYSVNQGGKSRCCIGGVYCL